MSQFLRMLFISITCLLALDITSLAQEIDKTVSTTQPASTTQPGSTTQPVSTTRPTSTTKPATAPLEDEETEMLTEDSGEAAAPLEYGIIRSNALGADREPEPPRYVIKRWISSDGTLNCQALRNSIGFNSVCNKGRGSCIATTTIGQISKRITDFLMRTRGYLGIHKVLDPLRLGFEFQDSRSFASDLDSDIAEDPSTTDEADVLQAFAELYFHDALGDGQPLSLRAGRLSFDAVDRRLLARNRFRNTTNAFDGFRIQIGSSESRWQLTGFAMMKVERFMTARDQCNEEEWFYGLAGYLRQLVPICNP